MYEAPRIEAVGSVRGMTLTRDGCFLGKTVNENEDWLGALVPDKLLGPIGDCQYS